MVRLELDRLELAKWSCVFRLETAAREESRLRVREQDSHLEAKRAEVVFGDELREKFQAAEAALFDADVLLFADFNYGCLAQPVVDHISALGRERGVLMAADSQASSQMSDISRFKGMCLITPTEHEVRLALREQEAGLIIIAERLQRVAEVENVVITLGSEGLLIYAPQKGNYHTDRLPAFNGAPKDVAGAGDSFFTCAAMALRAGADIWQATYLGSVAAAWQVSHIGNTPLTIANLLREVSNPALKIQEYQL
jgi:bifunctional ADP-heptose synthase (sugar kinase/adenylyltransferase)